MSSKDLKSLLTICIPTYNRYKYLDSTLKQITNSPFKECEIYVSDNCSIDETKSIVEKYPSVVYKRNKFNIGGNANILRCAEYGQGTYLWIIGDDDVYDFSNIEDVIEKLKEEKLELVHVGAHTDVPWKFGGQNKKIKDLVDDGYPYFRFSSFIGCNIIKRDSFLKEIINGYKNINYSYPHMPYLLSLYEKNSYIYISKNQITKAILGNQSYTFCECIIWWLNTSLLLRNRQDQIKCFFDQFNGSNKELTKLFFYSYKQSKINKESYNVIKKFLNNKKFILYLNLRYYMVKIINHLRKKHN